MKSSSGSRLEEYCENESVNGEVKSNESNEFLGYSYQNPLTETQFLDMINQYKHSNNHSDEGKKNQK